MREEENIIIKIGIKYVSDKNNIILKGKRVYNPLSLLYDKQKIKRIYFYKKSLVYGI